MANELSAEALGLVEHQAAWWFDAAPGEKAEVSDLLRFVGRALALFQEELLPDQHGSVHENVLSLLGSADQVGRGIDTDGAAARFRAKCREHCDYLAAKFAERKLPSPWLLVSGIPSGSLDVNGRREIATVVRETVNHLANHAREILPLEGRHVPAVAGPSLAGQEAAAARTGALLRFVRSVDDSAKQRRYMYVGNQTAIVEMHNDYSLFVDLRDLSLVPTLLQTGWWEPWIEQILRSILVPGMSYVNAGANVGYHSCLGAKLVEHTGKVFIFEANPHVFKFLRRSVFYNGFSTRSTLFNAAVSDSAGDTQFYFCREQAGGGGVFDPRATLMEAPARSGEETFSYSIGDFEVLDVARVTLDATVGQRIDELDLLHMDIEGSEGAAVLGARDLIGRSRNLRILMEWSPGGRSPAVLEQHRAAAAYLSGCGFKFYRVAPPSGNVFSNPPGLEHVDVQNLMSLSHSDLFLARE